MFDIYDTIFIFWVRLSHSFNENDWWMTSDGSFWKSKKFQFQKFVEIASFISNSWLGNFLEMRQ